jgi:hypothetical protein
LKNLADILPWIPELFRDFAALLPEAAEICPGEEGHIWYIGERRVDLAHALRAQRVPDTRNKTGRTVLIGDNRDELFAERERLRGDCMGFLREIRTPGWSNGLPRPAQAIAASFCVSRFTASEAAAFLQEACASLAAGGVLFWIDFFLPQSLSILAQYQKALAEEFRAGTEENAAVPERASGADSFNTLLRERNPMLPEAAIPLLAKAGFGNMEIIAKRMCMAAIAAYK